MTDLEKELVEKLSKLTDTISEIPAGSWKVAVLKVCSAGETIPVLTQREIDLILPLISHTQALVAAAYAACAEHLPPLPDATLVSCSCGAYFSSRAAWQAHIRALTPADAVRELERRDESVRADTIMRFRKVLDRLDIHGYYNEMQREFGCDEASLTKPAPVEKKKENVDEHD